MLRTYQSSLHELTLAVLFGGRATQTIKDAVRRQPLVCTPPAPASDATPMGRKGKKLTSWRNRLQISLQTIQVKLVKNLNNLVTYNQKYNFKFMVFKRNSKWAWLEGGPAGRRMGYLFLPTPPPNASERPRRRRCGVTRPPLPPPENRPKSRPEGLEALLKAVSPLLARAE